MGKKGMEKLPFLQGIYLQCTNIWESERKDFQPRHGCEKYISGIYHDHESGMPTFSLEFSFAYCSKQLWSR